MEWKARILNTRDWSANGVLVDRVIELETPAEFSFEAGQFVMIGHEKVKNKANPAQLRWGSMSIASSSQKKGSIELVISVGSPEGITFFVAHQLKKGDYLLARGPFGVFGIKDSFDELVFVAAGTGIAPLMSMIRSRLDLGEKKSLTLFFGFKTHDYFLYKEELEALEKKYINFHLYYITSREKTTNGKQGHVQELLKEHRFDQKKNIQFYICGPPLAVTGVRQTLSELGFSDKQVHFEQWG